MHSRQRVFRDIGRFFSVADHLSRNAQDSSGGAIVQGERPQQILICRSGARSESLQKYREAYERRASKTVNGLAMVAHHDQVGALAAEQPEQFQLRDVGVLKLVDENVPVARAERFSQRFVRAEMKDGVHDLRAKRKQLAFAEEKITGPVSSRNFLDLGDLFVADAALVLRHRAADGAKVFCFFLRIALVLIWRNQFILAA